MRPSPCYQHDSWHSEYGKGEVPPYAGLEPFGAKDRFFLTFNHFYKFGCFSTNCSKANRRVLCLENLEFLKLEYLVLLV